MLVIGLSPPFEPIILQEANHETVKSSIHLDRLPQEPFEKKIRYDPTKPSLSHFAKSLVKGRSVRLRQMKFYLF
jgi:hypothetical protein